MIASFLALPFLFPILIVMAAFLAPLGLLAIIEAVFFVADLKGASPLTFRERLAVSAANFKFGIRMGTAQYLAFLGKALGLVGSFAVLAALLLCIGVPAIVVGTIAGALTFFVGAFWGVAKTTAEYVVEKIAAGLGYVTDRAVLSLA